MEDIYLSIVIPAYNEAERISATLASVDEYLGSYNFSYEITVVNDGSTDATAAVVKDFQSPIHNLRLIDYADNRGKGYAVRRGMEVSRGRYLLFMDADNSVHISAVEPFISAMRFGADLVIASISIPGSTVIEHNAWHRRILGSLSKLVVNMLAVPGIYDTQRGFKIFTSSAAHRIFPLQTIDGFGFDIELLVIAQIQGLKIKELPVVWNNPEGSKVRLMDYARTFSELCRILFNKLRGRYKTEYPSPPLPGK